MERDRIGSFFFKIFGPATVEGALQGSTPEAREQWRRFRENGRRASAPPVTEPARPDPIVRAGS